MHDFVIKNGRVIDPASSIDALTDVYVENGRISCIGTAPPLSKDHRQWNSVDATGCIVTAGLLDCHVHAYEHATPLGINIDRECLARGVTTVVDAGSAGSTTFPGLREFIAKQSKTRLFCFLHIAQHGLAAAGCVTLGIGGECDSLNVVNVEDCVRVINENRDLIIGVKVRLAEKITDNGRNEGEVYRRARQAAGRCQVPLMVHHSLSTIGHEGCPGDLGPGDIYTHCFHGHNDSVVDKSTGKIDQYCLDAKKRGVLFDVGHGQGSFTWEVAEKCAAAGFWPDIISTDLHTNSHEGPAYDLLCVMTKMLRVGMPLESIIAAVTSTPAKAIGKLGEVGQLKVGAQADITILKLEVVSEELEDVNGEMRTIKQAFTPVAAFVGGESINISTERSWPNAASAEACREHHATHNY